MFRSTFLVSLLLLCAAVASSQTPTPKDVDITAPDGTKLRATFFAAGKPGPGVLLLHMCNTVRKSWEPVAKGLSEVGINALTIDNRGFGESGGPRFEGGSPEVLKQLNDAWPGDFDAAYQFLVAQPGVDKERIAAGGGSCGFDNALKLAERHMDVKALVLLAGGTDLAGINYIIHHPEVPIFTAGAADDQYNPATLPLMQWFCDLSGNPRSKFVGYPDGRHGTEIFGPHPELVRQIVAFFVDTLITSPVDLKAPVTPRKTAASDFWVTASEPGGAAKAAQIFHDVRKRDPGAFVFAEFPMNVLAYARLQAGDTEGAITLFKLNTEAYPVSANAEDSLSDGYLAAGKKDLALAAEEKCVELLPADKANADFKAQLGKAAQEKIAKLKAEQK
ncbi:MAG TPA: acyl-CoA thioester hydrolase/BAAT C-terminal domain-containing protein [Candidatus Dormibacteraeota bacterium]|nr:acyl-CoA thioester hydrolase/BAAT C-terminal domain-containing protein [Candidatus Dormibacteraeota bacterium]